MVVDSSIVKGIQKEARAGITPAGNKNRM